MGHSLTFHVSTVADWSRPSNTAALWGIDGATERCLTAQGLDCRRLTSDELSGEDLIPVGQPEDCDDAALYSALRQRMLQGATVLFLSAQLFKDDPRAMDWLPLENTGGCTTVRVMLYHKERGANRDPVFSGLPGPGVMDMDYYGQVIPHEACKDQDMPDETICAGFNTGYIFMPRGYGSNMLIALYKSGRGRFVLSTPYILENLDAHPAADRLLINLVRFAQWR